MNIKDALHDLELVFVDKDGGKHNIKAVEYDLDNEGVTVYLLEVDELESSNLEKK